MEEYLKLSTLDTHPMTTKRAHECVNRLFALLFSAKLLFSATISLLRHFATHYADVRKSFLLAIAYHAKVMESDRCAVLLKFFLLRLKPEPLAQECLLDVPRPSDEELRKAYQTAMFALLQQPLPQNTHTSILEKCELHIFPNLNSPQLLLDYLVDMYAAGGEAGIHALGSLLILIRDYHLDYPHFYQDLYETLTIESLRATYTAKLLRLLTLSLSSMHISTILVASFLKRLARLSLTAEPSTIIVILPITYNLIKSHTGCMKMIHRPDAPEHYEDPFDADESNPQQTYAINSCLWELKTLQSHYHPTISTLAKVISTQFTKPSYDIEDFLDHTYHSLFTADADRKIRKAPAIEEDTEKDIFDGKNAGGFSVLNSLWDF